MSVISAVTFARLFQNTVALEDSNIHFHTYVGEELPILGVAKGNVKYGSQGENHT